MYSSYLKQDFTSTTQKKAMQSNNTSKQVNQKKALSPSSFLKPGQPNMFSSIQTKPNNKVKVKRSNISPLQLKCIQLVKSIKMSKVTPKKTSKKMPKKVPLKRYNPLRSQYMGATPGKSSKTGQAVIRRMRANKQIRENGKITEFLEISNGIWYPISMADMGHVKDAVTWWNTKGHRYGPKSQRVRKFMRNPNNYQLEYNSFNRSKGSVLGKTTSYTLPDPNPIAYTAPKGWEKTKEGWQ